MGIDRLVADDIDVLLDGTMEILGRMPWSSNATFLVALRGDHEEQCLQGIYKPAKGERALWDFPRHLYRREVAAYELAAWLGWELIPRTVERDGDYGVGSVQLFIDARFEEHYFTLLEKGDADVVDQLRAMAVFDVLANNADRKGGHCLIDADDHVWGIDQGLCFHTESKLRTVIWDFAGERVGADLLDDVARLAEADESALGPLTDHLGEDEIEALLARSRRLLAKPKYPEPRSGHPYPWPLV